MGKSANPKNPGSWNRYAYAGDDPVNRNDPSGKISCADWFYYLESVGTISSFGGDGDDDDSAEGNCASDGANIATDFDPCSVDPGSLALLDAGLSCQVADPPPSSFQTTVTAQPICDLDLLAQPAGPAIDPFDHTLLEVTLSNGQTHYLEGVPIPMNPAQSNVVTDPMWLNASDRTTGSYYSNPTTTLASSIETDSLCDKLIKLVDGFANNTITYNNSWPWAGPNSNSFTNSLLNTVGLAANGMSNFWFPGWSNTSVPFGN